MLFDDTKGNKTSKSMKFKTIRVTKIIRTIFSNVDNPHQNLTTGFSLRESNHRFEIKLIQKKKKFKTLFFSERWNISKSLTLLIVKLLSTFCKSIQYFQNIYFYTGVHCKTVRQKDNLGHSTEYKDQTSNYVIFIWLNIFQKSFLFII